MSEMKKAKIKFPNGELLEVDVADNCFSRAFGLSGCREKKALLFVFPFQSFWSFWMPRMHYSLKLIFMKSDGKIVDIQSAIPMGFSPKTWKIYTPKEVCKYVLESPFEHDVKVGDYLKLSF